MNFEKDNKVICLLNNRASLTVGKEYTILDTDGDHVRVKNDNDDEWTYYTHSRFVHKSEFRKFIIDKIVDNEQ